MKIIYLLKNGVFNLASSFFKPRKKNIAVSLPYDSPELYVKENKESNFQRGYESSGDQKALQGLIEEHTAPLDRMCNKELEPYQNQKSENEIRIAEISEDLKKPDSERVAKHKEQATKENNIKKQEHHKKKKATQNLLNQCTKNKKKSEALLATMQRFWRHFPAKKSQFDKVWTIIVLAILIGVLESIFTVPALENAGIPDIISYLVAIAFSVLIGVSADQTGENHISKNIAFRNAWFISGFLLIILIIATRWGMEENLVLSGLNLLIYFFAVLLSVRRYKHKAYWDVFDTVADYTKKEDHLTNEMEGFEQVKLDLNEDNKAQASIDAKNEEKALKTEKTRLIKSNRTLNNKIKTIMKKYDNLKGEVKQTITNGYQEGKRNDTPPPLGFAFNKTAVVTWLAILCLSLSACSVETTDTEIVIAKDVSSSIEKENPYSGEKLFNETISEIGFDNNGYDIYAGVTVHLSQIGYPSLPKTNTVSIPPVTKRLERKKKKRKEAIEKFKDDLKTAIDDLLAESPTHGSTKISRSLCYHINKLTQSNAKHKKIYALTDALQEGSGVDFFDYVTNESDIERFKKEYDTISDKLSKDCSIEGTTEGISIDFIYPATEVKDEAFIAATDFWKHHYQKINIPVDRDSDF